jgi:hypothetical protein
MLSDFCRRAKIFMRRLADLDLTAAQSQHEPLEAESAGHLRPRARQWITGFDTAFAQKIRLGSSIGPAGPLGRKLVFHFPSSPNRPSNNDPRADSMS